MKKTKIIIKFSMMRSSPEDNRLSLARGTNIAIPNWCLKSSANYGAKDVSSNLVIVTPYTLPTQCKYVWVDTFIASQHNCQRARYGNWTLVSRSKAFYSSRPGSDWDFTHVRLIFMNDSFIKCVSSILKYWRNFLITEKNELINQPHSVVHPGLYCRWPWQITS